MNTILKPWGNYRVLDQSNVTCVKILRVNPKSRLSLQTHKKRSEIWFPTTNGLRARIGDKLIDLKMFERYEIAPGVKHRLINPTNNPLELIELMLGEYDEEDIERLEDDYERI
jgi:mannose-1-phosphate guanylyltransferase/mannose-6-phosphate isomerase